MNKSSPEALWGEVLETLAPDVGADNFELWLKPVEAVRLDGQVLRLRVPNKFFTEWIKEHYQPKIEALLKKLTGAELAVDYEVTKDLRNVLPQADPIEPARPQSEFALSELNPRYTFEKFVVGPSNRLAHAAAEHVAKKPGTQFNPFFIYGGVGLGKTHLMHAIGHALRTSRAHARVLYTTSEQFVNEYIDSLRYDKPDAFRSKYRNLDCLLIDDIQFLIAKGRSEEEFFYTFNSLHDAKKQIVISSDRAPKEMAPSEQRLISRFMWGQVVDIKPPDLETRIAILRKKAETEGLFVPADVILYAASAIKTNIRELEGALIRLSAFASLTGNPLTVDTAKEILKDSIDHDVTAPVRVETIQRVVADRFHVEVRDLKSRSRTTEVVFPRQLAIYLTCTHTGLSTTEVGKAFGGRDHSTVVHARDKVKDLLTKDLILVDTMNRLTEQIKAVENS